MKPYSRKWWACMAAVSVAGVWAMVNQPAQADEWTGKDKAGHAQAGALVGTVFAAAAQSRTVGCLAAVGVGAAKELFDMQHKDTHTASVKDFGVTALAGCLAARVSGIVLGPRFIGITKEF